MPSKKIQPVSVFRFSNTGEEKGLYAEVKSSIRKRWQPGQQIAWFDFWNWLHGFLEQEVRALFVFGIINLLIQEKVIKRAGTDIYELVQ